MHVRTGCLVLILAMSGVATACSDKDVDRMLGGGRGGDRSLAQSAMRACANEAEDRGWEVLGSERPETSDDDSMLVTMRVRRDDGSTRRVRCTYDGDWGGADLDD